VAVLLPRSGAPGVSLSCFGKDGSEGHGVSMLECAAASRPALRVLRTRPAWVGDGPPQAWCVPLEKVDREFHSGPCMCTPCALSFFSSERAAAGYVAPPRRQQGVRRLRRRHLHCRPFCPMLEQGCRPWRPCGPCWRCCRRVPWRARAAGVGSVRMRPALRFEQKGTCAACTATCDGQASTVELRSCTRLASRRAALSSLTDRCRTSASFLAERPGADRWGARATGAVGCSPRCHGQCLQIVLLWAVVLRLFGSCPWVRLQNLLHDAGKACSCWMLSFARSSLSC
jgi:hypothetical protein